MLSGENGWVGTNGPGRQILRYLHPSGQQPRYQATNGASRLWWPAHNRPWLATSMRPT